MLRPSRDCKKSHLLDLKLLAYSYLFYANMISVGAFYMYFDYMARRGPHTVPNPVPADDDGTRTFPAGYSASQLIGAWNWGLNSGNLGSDEIQAANVASSIFYVAIVTGQIFHLLSIRRKSPYCVDSIMGTGKYLAATTDQNQRQYVLLRLLDEMSHMPWQIQWPIVFAWIGAVVVAVIVTSVSVFQQYCGTGAVPALYWGMGFGFGALWFAVAEVRKWLIVLFPLSVGTKIAW